MKCNECTRWLHDYVDGDLAPETLRACEAHVAGCAICQAELDGLRRLRSVTRNLPREIVPQRDLWAGLQERMTDGGTSDVRSNYIQSFSDEQAIRTPDKKEYSPVLRWFAPLAMAASVALLATLAERQITPHNPAGWSIAALSGTPQFNTRNVRDDVRMRVGQWLVTDDASRAKIQNGAIGEVSVEPNSRLRLTGMAATDHRLELARGTLNAMIWAPPRLFFVDTPSATAVDLGCAYTLTVDDDGNGELKVSLGFVALEDRGRESIIRTGMMCLTRRGVGPGTPFAVDAPASLRASLTRFDFERGAADAALSEVLTNVRPDDAITLWHLLDRTRDAQRARVFDTLAGFSPPPPGITREGILAGDNVMRRAWGSHLGIDRF